MVQWLVTLFQLLQLRDALFFDCTAMVIRNNLHHRQLIYCPHCYPPSQNPESHQTNR